MKFQLLNLNSGKIFIDQLFFILEKKYFRNLEISFVFKFRKSPFEKSLKMLETAKLAKDNDDYFSANNRLYYALFHAIRSVLALDKVDFKKHSNVLGYFNKYYIATNIFDKSFGKLIASASIIRNNSDYEDFYLINCSVSFLLIK